MKRVLQIPGPRPALAFQVAAARLLGIGARTSRLGARWEPRDSEVSLRLLLARRIDVAPVFEQIFRVEKWSVCRG
jgi:hypothetical protein